MYVFFTHTKISEAVLYVLFLFFQVEHSDASAITELLQSAGYKVLHRFAKQDIFYVKDN
jgi:hypothetical protein